MDLHRPYYVPEEYLHLSLNERYKKNIEELDFWIGKFLSEIDLTKTLVVITSDHGEYVSQLQAFDAPENSNYLKKVLKKSVKSVIPKNFQIKVHKKKKNILGQIKTRNLTVQEKRAAIRTRVGKKRELFDDIQKIPLLFCGSSISKNQLIEQQVRSVDILPTILELNEISDMPKNIHGRSILSLIEKKQLESLPVYMESSYGKTATEIPDSVVGIRTDKYKYFRDAKESGKNVHLFDLTKDPDELDNLSKSSPQIVSNMEKILQEIVNSKFDESSKTELTSEEEKELEDELRKMGYV